MISKIFLCGLLSAVAFAAACTKLKTGQSDASPVPSREATRKRATDQSIRSIDFANFTYPRTVDLTAPGKVKETFTLRDGDLPDRPGQLGMTLHSIVYTDMTGDDAEEAIVVLEVDTTNGTAIPHAVYIYTLRNKQPQLLWSFDTGDRADGGLRNIYADQGDVVVELYGKGKVLGSDLYADDGTKAETPYPYYFTQTRYKWNGTQFKQKGTPVIQSNSNNYGSPIMPPYERSTSHQQFYPTSQYLSASYVEHYQHSNWPLSVFI